MWWVCDLLPTPFGKSRVGSAATILLPQCGVEVWWIPASLFANFPHKFSLWWFRELVNLIFLSRVVKRPSVVGLVLLYDCRHTQKRRPGNKRKGMLMTIYLLAQIPFAGSTRWWMTLWESIDSLWFSWYCPSTEGTTCCFLCHKFALSSASCKK